MLVEDWTQYKIWARPGDKLRLHREGVDRIVTDSLTIVNEKNGYTWQPAASGGEIRGLSITRLGEYFPVDKYYKGSRFTVSERYDSVDLDYIPEEARPVELDFSGSCTSATIFDNLAEEHTFSCSEWDLQGHHEAYGNKDTWVLTRKKR